jgi:hypothetical protein
MRSCWDEAMLPAEYTLRADIASYDCPTPTCPDPTLLTLSSDDIVAATETEYAESEGWIIEGDLIWE